MDVRLPTCCPLSFEVACLVWLELIVVLCR